MREAGPLRDVGDAGVEEAVALEDLLRRADEPRPGLDALAGPGPTGLFAGEAAAWSTRPSPSVLAPGAAASMYRRYQGRWADTRGGRTVSGVLPLQQEDARGGAAAGGHDGGGRVGDLALARVVPQLLHRFVDETEAVRATLGELATVRVDGEFAVERDAASAVEPVVGLAEPAESQALDPRDGVEGEPVVDERQVDFGRAARRSSSRDARPGRSPGARG